MVNAIVSDSLSDSLRHLDKMLPLSSNSISFFPDGLNDGLLCFDRTQDTRVEKRDASLKETVLRLAALQEEENQNEDKVEGTELKITTEAKDEDDDAEFKTRYENFLGHALGNNNDDDEYDDTLDQFGASMPAIPAGGLDEDEETEEEKWTRNKVKGGRLMDVPVPHSKIRERGDEENDDKMMME